MRDTDRGRAVYSPVCVACRSLGGAASSASGKPPLLSTMPEAWCVSLASFMKGEWLESGLCRNATRINLAYQFILSCSQAHWHAKSSSHAMRARMPQWPSLSEPLGHHSLQVILNLAMQAGGLFPSKKAHPEDQGVIAQVTLGPLYTVLEQAVWNVNIECTRCRLEYF